MVTASQEREDMKYSDLIQFDPIEKVVQLNEAESDDQALRLV